MTYCDHFEIDIISALADQLVSAFEALSNGALSIQNIANVPAHQGVYKLYLDDLLVYVGKANNLRKRLAEHRRKLSGRQNVDLADMSFRCLTVHKNWTTLAPEESLIKYYKEQDTGVCEWNGNSFGPHDPGRNRETTNKEPMGFDAQYPIKLDWVVDWIEPKNWNGRELLQELKSGLPYLLRYQLTNRKRWRDGHPDYNNATIQVSSANMMAIDLLSLIASQLNGWQATAFPSHLILYKENVTYAHGTRI